MRNLRSLSLCAAMLVVSIANAYAAERFPYEAKAFQAAQDSEKSILVHVTAPWCTECKMQKPIVADFASQPEFQKLTIFDVDFDTQKDALQALRIPKQATIAVFKGKTETGRIVGVTKRDAIYEVMKKAM